MGQEVSRTDFEWAYNDEPHATRRKEILQKYPEIKQLMGYDPKFKYIAGSVVLVQFAMLFVLKNQSWSVTLFVAYCFGGVLNHSLMAGMHEALHNLAFKSILANRLFGIFMNLPIGIPAAISFKKYHVDHHKYAGDEILDVDIPTELEARVFHTTLGKLLWVILMPFFYTLRPMVVNPKPFVPLEVLNVVVQLIFNVFVLQYFGFRLIFGYYIMGSLMVLSLHPTAGHFIAEHYMFIKGYETYSYYGIFNLIVYNGGYHNEHHDFPSIPGSRLPEVRRIAPEYYNNLPIHTSWIKVIYDYITDPALGPYARIKRKTKKNVKAN